MYANLKNHLGGERSQDRMQNVTKQFNYYKFMKQAQQREWE